MTEARERVRGAIRNAGYTFPARRITINLAPADLRKAGASLDLAMAMAILLGSEQGRAGSRPSGPPRRAVARRRGRAGARASCRWSRRCAPGGRRSGRRRRRPPSTRRGWSTASTSSASRTLAEAADVVQGRRTRRAAPVAMPRVTIGAVDAAGRDDPRRRAGPRRDPAVPGPRRGPRPGAGAPGPRDRPGRRPRAAPVRAARGRQDPAGADDPGAAATARRRGRAGGHASWPRPPARDPIHELRRRPPFRAPHHTPVVRGDGRRRAEPVTRARSPGPITGCCSSTSWPSSIGTSSRRCASRSRTSGSSSPGPVG